MRSILAAAICATLPFAAHAQSYEAINGLNVIPLGGSSFEVIEARGEGPSGIWCAAASYAQDRVGLSNTTRLYIKTPRGPSISGAGRTGVVFTSDPNDLPSPPIKSYSISVDQQSIGLTIGHSIQYCQDYIIELNDL
ncbi:MAG: hypothetical protein GQ539_07440 [Sulfitobacter sp.]|nr:hypothetical protein [Sulfitobacter sp.]